MLVKIGKDLELNVETERFNSAVINHIIYMGLRNVLMDSHASHTKESGDDYLDRSIAAAQSKLASLYAGEVRAAGTRSTDPVARQMRALAETQVREALRAYCRTNGKKMGDFTPEQVTAAINKHIAKNEDSLRKTAKRMVKEAQSTDVDMTGIEI